MKKTICKLGKRLNPDRKNKKEDLVEDRGLPHITETQIAPICKPPKKETDGSNKNC